MLLNSLAGRGGGVVLGRDTWAERNLKRQRSSGASVEVVEQEDGTENRGTLIPVGTATGPVCTVWIHGAGTGAHLFPMEIARN